MNPQNTEPNFIPKEGDLVSLEGQKSQTPAFEEEKKNINNKPSEVANADSQNISNINNENNQTVNTATPVSSNINKSKVSVQVKQGNGIGSPGLIIGCVGFFVLFIGIVFAALFFAAGNPQTLQSIGMSTDTVKTLLSIFAGLFFGIIILALLGLTTYNGYKAATIKEGSKAKNIFGLVVSFFFMLVFVALAIVSFTNIKNIQAGGGVGSTNLIIPYMEVKKSPGDSSSLNGKRSIFTANTKIIGPVNIYYQLNNTVFNDQIVSTIGQNSTISYVKLDCGNGQVLDSRVVAFDAINMRTQPCFYVKKGDYATSLEYGYTTINGLTNSIKVPLQNLNVVSEISFLGDKKEYTFNDKKTEIIVGNSPAKVNINAQKIFTDLGLTDVSIAWDLDGDGNVDKTDRADFTQYYLKPKLYDINYTLPGFDYTFVAKIRVNAGDVPPCDISKQLISDSNYRFTLNIEDNQTDVSSYKFDIIDAQNDDIIKSINSDRKIFEYSFDPGNTYKIRGFFTTTENKNGFCESDDINIGNQGYQILTAFYTKLPTEKNYTKIDISGQNTSFDSAIEINDLPTLLQFRIEKTIPPVSNQKYEVYKDGRLILPSDQGVYTIQIDNSSEQTLQIKGFDDNQKEYYKNFKIIIKKKNAIANIRVDKSVGFDPLVVNLDASISKLNDFDDEIIYFTRDFGDGQTLNNISQGKITHSYRFDTAKESGEYYPKVTIKTKKGYTDVYTMTNPIVVKRQLRTAKININSHPGQIAKVGDVVNLSLETDGDVKSINWTFGNDKSMSCSDRSCLETNVTYDEPGYYDIVATIDYSDSPSNTQTVKVKIE